MTDEWKDDDDALDLGTAIEEVTIGTTKLTRFRPPYPTLETMAIGGELPFLVVLVENEGQPPALTWHMASAGNGTDDERWARVQAIVARRHGLVPPA